eukprot:NODE_191_length_15469_cov_0.243071.p7 type:complete len:179 gc:universal NODE_191_length_15469_cov_0.243071:6234-5698(-)
MLESIANLSSHKWCVVFPTKSKLTSDFASPTPLSLLTSCIMSGLFICPDVSELSFRNNAFISFKSSGCSMQKSPPLTIQSPLRISLVWVFINCFITRNCFSFPTEYCFKLLRSKENRYIDLSSATCIFANNPALLWNLSPKSPFFSDIVLIATIGIFEIIAKPLSKFPQTDLPLELAT